MITYSIASSGIGKILVASSNKGVCMVSMGESDVGLERVLHNRFPRESVRKDNAGMEKTVSAIQEMVDGRRSPSTMKFDLDGTDFQKRVWAELLKIPSGQTRSYAEIAESIGHPNAYRAVANACGANPVAIAVPCHRVIASDGQIGGYGGGVARKRKLLENEGVVV